MREVEEAPEAGTDLHREVVEAEEGVPAIEEAPQATITTAEEAPRVGTSTVEEVEGITTPLPEDPTEVEEAAMGRED